MDALLLMVCADGESSPCVCCWDCWPAAALSAVCLELPRCALCGLEAIAGVLLACICLLCASWFVLVCEGAVALPLDVLLL